MMYPYLSSRLPLRTKDSHEEIARGYCISCEMKMPQAPRMEYSTLSTLEWKVNDMEIEIVALVINWSVKVTVPPNRRK